MSLINKLTTKAPSQKVGEFSLETQEIELLLTLIKNSTFKGEQLEELYTLVYKLQQQYLDQN
jgi:hypothetical protein